MKGSAIIESDYPRVDVQNLNIWTFLHPYLEKWKKFTAVVCCQTLNSYTYEEYTEASLRWGKELKKYVINGRPPVVGILSPNVIEYPMLFLGAAGIGAPVCIIRHDNNADLVSYILTQSKTTVLVIDSSILENFLDVLEAFEGKLVVYVRGPTNKYPNGKDLFKVMFSDEVGLDVETVKEVDSECIAVIAYSSGTTGKPKGILLSHNTLTNSVSCYTQQPFFPIRSATEYGQETLIATLPLSHAYGLVYFSIAAPTKGCKLVDFQSPNFLDVLPIMEKFKPQVLKVYPHHLEAMSRVDKIDAAFESVRVVVNVGSPHNPECFKKLNDKLGGTLFLQEVYGTTEIGLVIATPMNEECIGMTGKLVPNVQIRFVHLISGEPIVDPHQVGEIYLKNYMMKGYLNNPKTTRDAIQDGWYRTGDVGYFDENNFISVIERISEFITIDEEKINPVTIERILKRHASVIDVGIVGAPTMITGEEKIQAFVVRKDAVDEIELMKFVEKNAPPIMALQGVTFVDELPRNHLGKLVRKTLRDISWCT